MLSLQRSCLLLVLYCSLGFALESFVAEDGYETFPSLPGSRYKLYTIHHTWPQALSLCQEDGGGSHLLIINSESEASIARSLFARITDSETLFLYVGIDDIVVHGTWKTVQGDLVSTSGYNVWDTWEPDNPSFQHAGIIFRSGKYGSHNDDDYLPFACEKPDV